MPSGWPGALVEGLWRYGVHRALASRKRAMGEKMGQGPPIVPLKGPLDTYPSGEGNEGSGIMPLPPSGGSKIRR